MFSCTPQLQPQLDPNPVSHSFALQWTISDVIPALLSSALDFAVVPTGPGLSGAALASQGVVSVPVLAEAVVVAYNLPGVSVGVSMAWTRETLVAVFNGSIALWNDPRIARQNPFITFPPLPIVIATLDR